MCSMLDRINVVGSSGSGKSTVSKSIALKLRHPVIQLDQLFWRQDWTFVTEDEMIALIKDKLSQPKWVLDGNFNKFEPIKWQEVQMVVWVDTPFILNLWQVFRRCIKRAISQEEVWEGSGCRESFRRSFFSKDSIILWVLKTWGSYRRIYSGYIESNEYPHIKWVRLRSRKEIQNFIDSLPG